MKKKNRKTREEETDHERVMNSIYTLTKGFYENTISTNLSNQIGAKRRMYRPRKVKFDELKLNVDEHVDELE